MVYFRLEGSPSTGGLECRLAMSSISKRKQAEQTLHEINQRMDNILEGAHIGTWEWNVQTGATVFNEVWAQIVGYTLAELMPTSIKTWETLTHPADLQKSDELLARYFAGELPFYDCECRMTHKDGHWVWVHDRGGAITRTVDGKPLMLFGTHSDITERKRAEDALRESEARFRNMTDTAPVLVWMSGVDALCYYFNQRWLSFTGRTVEQEMGNGWAEGVHPDDMQRCLDIYMGAFNARTEFKMEYRLRRADGEYRWLLDNGVPRYTPEGVFAGYIGSCIDITVNKDAEAAIHESEMRYRAMVEGSPNAIVIHRGGAIIYVNKAAVKMFGAASVHDLVGQPVLERIHPDFHHLVLARINKTIEHHADLPKITNRYLKLDGTGFDAEVEGTAITYDGAPAILITMRDLTELRLRAELEQLATTDMLTGISNRRHFLTLAPDALERAMRLHHPLALVMIDVDGLKQVNDLHGHAAGDQVLTAFSQCCSKNIRGIDVFARIGGDEFVLLLPGTTGVEATKVMERILLALREQPIEVQGKPYIITISAGITELANATDTIDALLARADSAMYRAKTAGRNRVSM